MAKRKATTSPSLSPSRASSPEHEPVPKKARKLSPADKDAAFLVSLRKRRKDLDVTNAEAVLAAQLSEWKTNGTESYNHYTLPPTIVELGGVVKYQFHCKMFPTKLITRARYDTSTSNLRSATTSAAARLNPVLLIQSSSTPRAAIIMRGNFVTGWPSGLLFVTAPTLSSRTRSS
ncbi:hypothetical protein C8F01DRAFT_1372980 [Mycena amicta]|nr:hypothetical protein C8F01DRAFT_1372980 [Mycena amicta]